MRTSLIICASLVVLMFVATGCYEVEYTVETKGDTCIKFEDAMYDQDPDEFIEDWVEACLGEDGAVEADVFFVEVDGDATAIDVALKAGKCKDDGTIDLSDPVALDLCGFSVQLIEADAGTYILAVISDDIEGGKDGTAALSNVEFCFVDATVVAPEEETVTVSRIEETDDD